MAAGFSASDCWTVASFADATFSSGSSANVLCVWLKRYEQSESDDLVGVP